MNLNKLRAKRSPRLMIIPMIDIIFFLLVFFMMSTLSMVEQQTIPVNLPQAASAQSDKPSSIAVTITQAGRILFDQEDIPLEMVRKRAQIALANQNDILFVIKSDRQTEYGKVVAVLDEMKLAGAARIAIATERKDRSWN
ncbi:MAG: tolR: protein TolR [Firmicutes bacterium]|nr:tolR: protein TolR [Bacillota bacterium]